MAGSERQVEYEPIRIETADQALYDWFDRTVDCHVPYPNGERKKVPTIFSSGERWASARKKKGIRDKNGVLILPLISVRRTGIDPVPEMQALGTQTPNLQISKRIDPKTNLIQNNMFNRSPNYVPSQAGAVYEVTTIPFPDRNVINYEMIVQAQYITQMNDMLEKIFHELDIRKSFVMPFDNQHRHTQNGEQFEDRKPFKGGYFVGFFESTLSDGGNLEEFTDQERVIRYSTSIRVPATLQLDPEGERSSLRIEKTAFGLSFGGETVKFVDDPRELDKIFGRRR